MTNSATDAVISLFFTCEGLFEPITKKLKKRMTMRRLKENKIKNAIFHLFLFFNFILLFILNLYRFSKINIIYYLFPDFFYNIFFLNIFKNSLSHSFISCIIRMKKICMK